MKPWLLDLFCGAGGCTKGYQSAGFYVVGVDVKPQPRYCGDEFVQADALTYLATTDLAEFVVIHASPPCAYLIPSLALGPPSAPPTTLGAPRSASSGTPRTSPSRMNAWRSRLLKVPWRDFPCLELGALSGYPTTGGTMSAPDWRLGDLPEEKGQRSRVFRQTVEIEIVWLMEGEDDNGFRDWEAEVRSAVASADPPAHPGRSWTSDVEELVAVTSRPTTHDSEEDSR